MKQLTDKKWWRAAAIRAIKTVAQTAIASIGTAAMISSVDWRMVISASILAGLLSLLTSVAGLPEVIDENGGINGKKGDNVSFRDTEKEA